MSLQETIFSYTDIFSTPDVAPMIIGVVDGLGATGDRNQNPQGLWHHLHWLAEQPCHDDLGAGAEVICINLHGSHLADGWP